MAVAKRSGAFFVAALALTARGCGFNVALGEATIVTNATCEENNPHTTVASCEVAIAEYLRRLHGLDALIARRGAADLEKYRTKRIAIERKLFDSQKIIRVLRRESPG